MTHGHSYGPTRNRLYQKQLISGRNNHRDARDKSDAGEKPGEITQINRYDYAAIDASVLDATDIAYQVDDANGIRGDNGDTNNDDTDLDKYIVTVVAAYGDNDEDEDHENKEHMYHIN